MDGVFCDSQLTDALQSSEPLSAAALAAAPESQRKRVLGERLYVKIEQLFPGEAGKITGMLLEMDNSELLHLLEDQAALTDKAREAHNILTNL
jgi:polyadenylate-binding protein